MCPVLTVDVGALPTALYYPAQLRKLVQLTQGDSFDIWCSALGIMGCRQWYGNNGSCAMCFTLIAGFFWWFSCASARMTYLFICGGW